MDIIFSALTGMVVGAAGAVAVLRLLLAAPVGSRRASIAERLVGIAGGGGPGPRPEK